MKAMVLKKCHDVFFDDMYTYIYIYLLLFGFFCICFCLVGLDDLGDFDTYFVWRNRGLDFSRECLAVQAFHLVYILVWRGVRRVLNGPSTSMDWFKGTFTGKPHI